MKFNVIGFSPTTRDTIKSEGKYKGASHDSGIHSIQVFAVITYTLSLVFMRSLFMQVYRKSVEISRKFILFTFFLLFFPVLLVQAEDESYHRESI